MESASKSHCSDKEKYFNRTEFILVHPGDYCSYLRSRDSWSGTVKGSSNIKYYIIQKATSDDQVTWSTYVTATQKATTALSGTANLTVSNVRGTYTRFRIAVQDSLDAITEYVVSNTVRHTLLPNTPVVTAPVSNTKSYNLNPRLLIATGGAADGHTQDLRVKVGSTWFSSLDTPEYFSRSASVREA
jgi:hypothetical protein